MSSHPEHSLLLRYIDGELAERKARHVERHVEACQDCRAEVEELKKTVAECMRYRKEFSAEAMPQPPQAWGDIYTAFARVDLDVNQRDTPQRTGLLQLLRGVGSPFRLAVGAATAVLAIAGALYFGGTPFTKKAPARVIPSQEPQLLRNRAGSGAAPLEVPARPAVPSRPAAIDPGLTASISDELKVLKALHGIGADLGDPLHVSLSQGRVLVAGVGVAPERQRQIQTALGPLPRVAVEFSDPMAATLPADGAAVAPSSVSSDSQSPFEARLEAELGGRAGVDQFAGQVLGWNEKLMAHAYALRALAQQLPSDASLNETDRATLRSLAEDHQAAMEVPLGNFERAMNPVLNALGAAAHPHNTPLETTWQASAEQVFEAARNVEMLSSKLLGVARGEKANADSPSELLGAVSDLRAHLEQNHRLLGR
jgi:anti-sigma factor RsiW